jgi:hypothetical protein
MAKCLKGKYEFVPEGLCTIIYCGFECQDCHHRDMCVGANADANLLCRLLHRSGTNGYNIDGSMAKYRQDYEHD